MSSKADKNMKDLLRAVKEGMKLRVRVGILGAKNTREGEGSNAEIGAKHEFGEDGMPVRSFLRMPLENELDKYIQKSGALNKKSLDKVVQEKSLTPLLEKIGILAESIIAESFDTGGFGKWKRSNMKYKTVKQTLVESQQLRNSITSEVK